MVFSFLFLATACGLPGVPTLPAPGAEPAPVPWPDADRPVRAAAAAPLLVTGGAPAERCFRSHLEEAVELNEWRRPVYASWTDGRSESISNRLIAGERRGIPVARYVDRKARRYHEAGIPIVCVDLIPMWRAPQLDSTPAPPSGVAVPPAPDPDVVQRNLLDAYATAGFGGVVDAAVTELRELAAAPMYHCMVRHLLESVARVAALAPFHDRAAARANLPSTVPLSELMIRLHLAVLRESSELDRLAAPLQADGVSIICRDVPEVPYPRS